MKECSFCHCPFPSKLNMEAHRQRYPSHFTDHPAPNLQVDAVPQIKMTRRKKKTEEEVQDE